MIQKLIVDKVILLLAKKFKLIEVLKYVKEPNELDDKVSMLESKCKNLEKRLKRLENIDYTKYIMKGADE